MRTPAMPSSCFTPNSVNFDMCDARGNVEEVPAPLPQDRSLTVNGQPVGTHSHNWKTDIGWDQEEVFHALVERRPGEFEVEVIVDHGAVDARLSEVLVLSAPDATVFER